MRRTLLLTVTAALTLVAADGATAAERPSPRGATSPAQLHQIGGHEPHLEGSRRLRGHERFRHTERRRGGPPRHVAHGQWKHDNHRPRAHHHWHGPPHHLEAQRHRPGPWFRGRLYVKPPHGLHGKVVVVLPFGL